MKTSQRITLLGTFLGALVLPIASRAYSPTWSDRVAVSNATSGLQSIVSGNQTLTNLILKKIEPLTIANGRTPGKVQYIANALLQNIQCLEAVHAYRTTPQALSGATVQVGNTVLVDYITSQYDGVVVDTTIPSIASACGRYDPSRIYGSGIGFTVGSGSMVPGVESGVIGMQVGQIKTLRLTVDQAYGPSDPSKIIGFSTGDFDTVSKGDMVSLDNHNYVVADVTGGIVFVDTNPRLVGKDLVFDLKVKAIR